MRVFSLIFFATALVLAGWIDRAGAQVPLEVYENPVNLHVLPPDIAPEELRAIMTEFPRQVHIPCSGCHFGAADTPVAEYDFASDARERKRIAREMMVMVNQINAMIGSFGWEGDRKPLEVQCVTCHRGYQQPKMIEDILAEAYGEGGIAAAEKEYRNLRAIYGDGGFVFDFSARRLGDFANSLVAGGDLDGGMHFHGINTELNDRDGFVYLTRGEMFEGLGRLAEAIADFKTAMEREPTFTFLEERIEGLRKRIEQSER